MKWWLPLARKTQKPAGRNATTTSRRVIEASAACSDGDTLHADELCGCSNITLDLQVQLDALSNTLDELIERACLSVATGQIWNAGHVVALFITLHDNAELAFPVSSHGDDMPEER